MKRNCYLSLFAVAAVACGAVASYGQVAPSAGGTSAERPELAAKYEVFAGYGYTSLNQVNQSRYGLQGVNLSVTRNLSKYFGVTADGAYYGNGVGGGNPAPPPSDGSPLSPTADGNPTVSEVFFGPVLHANLYGRVDGFVHGLLGGAHTGGEEMTPKVAFGGGFGGGLDYKLSQRLSLRASGDAILAAFSFRNNSTQLGNSPHTTRNPRAAFGVVYRF